MLLLHNLSGWHSCFDNRTYCRAWGNKNAKKTRSRVPLIFSIRSFSVRATASLPIFLLLPLTEKNEVLSRRSPPPRYKHIIPDWLLHRPRKNETGRMRYIFPGGFRGSGGKRGEKKEDRRVVWISWRKGQCTVMGIILGREEREGRRG